MDVEYCIDPPGVRDKPYNRSWTIRVSVLSTGACTAGIDDVDVRGVLIADTVVVEDIILEGVRLTLVLLLLLLSSSSDTMSPTNDCTVTLATASSLIILIA